MSDVFAQMAQKIIDEQATIIGPIAVEQASLVKGMKVDAEHHSVSISSDPQSVIDHLVEQYKELFGQIAVETCKEAVSKLLVQVPPDQQPKSLL